MKPTVTQLYSAGEWVEIVCTPLVVMLLLNYDDDVGEKMCKVRCRRSRRLLWHCWHRFCLEAVVCVYTYKLSLPVLSFRTVLDAHASFLKKVLMAFICCRITLSFYWFFFELKPSTVLQPHPLYFRLLFLLLFLFASVDVISYRRVFFSQCRLPLTVSIPFLSLYSSFSSFCGFRFLSLFHSTSVSVLHFALHFI